MFIRLMISLAPMNVSIAFKRQNVRGDPVEEPAVVADDDNAPDVIQNGLLKGSERVDVQVIRRLVEQQNV